MANPDKEHLERLGQVELFKRCTKKDLEALADIVEDESVPAGAVICEQGRVADASYVVAEGEASVMVGDEIVGIVGPGESVGEMGLLDHLPRSATVTARTPMRLYRIDADRFAKLLESSAISRGLLEQLSLRIRHLESGRGRLASY
jgi:CRP-like cAMP-binding protein